MIPPAQRAIRFLVTGMLAVGASTPAPTQDVATPRGWNEFQRVAMGTTFRVRLRVQTPGDRAAAEAALDEVERLDRVLSTWRKGSFVSHLNATAAKRSVRLDVEVRQWLGQAIQLHRETEGAFDVTVGPLLRAWGFRGGTGRVPDDSQLERALALVGCEHLELDERASTLRFGRLGMELDFGAIGKGWAVDAAVRILRSSGIENALVEGGTSTVFAMGSPPDRAAGWSVRIRHPRLPGERIAEVNLRDAALSVSGDSERFFVHDGDRYGHVLDPRTGRPVRGIVMAAAFADSATRSDALSTAFFVLKEEGTRRYLRGHPSVRAFLCREDPRCEDPCCEDELSELRLVRLGFPDPPPDPPSIEPGR